MAYELLENDSFSKGDRVTTTRDIKLHFGGTLEKGEKGTYSHTELIGEKRWIKVNMDNGTNMSFTKDTDIQLLDE